ncbi:MAG TPA: hypothetical protein VFD59_05270 [Nocardioidaceae bacterium]|nr:hypothetical protein [Nocardioidaceae bacterium]
MSIRAVGKNGYVRVEDDCVVFVRGGRGKLRHPRYHPATVPFEGVIEVSLREPQGLESGRLCVRVYGFRDEEITRPDYPFCITFGAWQLANMRAVEAEISHRSVAVS